jgi:hypothetical protein
MLRRWHAGRDKVPLVEVRGEDLAARQVGTRRGAPLSAKTVIRARRTTGIVCARSAGPVDGPPLRCLPRAYLSPRGAGGGQ